MLMKPNKAQTGFHGRHCPGNMAVHMYEVLAGRWVGAGCVTCPFFFFFFFFFFFCSTSIVFFSRFELLFGKITHFIWILNSSVSCFCLGYNVGAGKIIETSFKMEKGRKEWGGGVGGKTIRIPRNLSWRSQQHC